MVDGLHRLRMDRLHGRLALLERLHLEDGLRVRNRVHRMVLSVDGRRDVGYLWLRVHGQLLLLNGLHRLGMEERLELALYLGLDALYLRCVKIKKLSGCFVLVGFLLYYTCFLWPYSTFS